MVDIPHMIVVVNMLIPFITTSICRCWDLTGNCIKVLRTGRTIVVAMLITLITASNSRCILTSNGGIMVVKSDKP